MPGRDVEGHDPAVGVPDHVRAPRAEQRREQCRVAFEVLPALGGSLPVTRPVGQHQVPPLSEGALLQRLPRHHRVFPRARGRRAEGPTR